MNLDRLRLRYNNIGDDGARALARRTNLGDLEIASNWIGVDGETELSALKPRTFVILIWRRD
ncbi:MAG: leucine-rich repeat domain-containing protein [Hyphomicrobium sp.]